MSLLLLYASTALARPDDGTGAWSYTDDDVLATFDSAGGTARVWYSTAGPNATVLDDEDGTGVPDFVELVAASTEAVLVFYADHGFRSPISDGARGGSAAMDVYLVDFALQADGMYAAETCTGTSPRQCSGYFLMENDFAGYGYSDLPTAIRVLTSHELFHAVQAAYDSNEEVWWAEGTATWAEWAFDPGTEDFLWLVDAFLEDTERSLNEPPAEPAPAFAYGTALWWWFLANRYGDGVIVELLEATEADDNLLEDMETIEAARGGSLLDDWSTFTRWNLATGSRSGLAESYPFANEVGPVKTTDRGETITDDNRYYPLAASYYELNHPGGNVWFALEADAPELTFSLHTEDEDGRVSDAITTWQGQAAPLDLGELAAGEYMLVGTNATLAENSTKVLTCLGSAETIAACATGDTGGDTADTGDTGGTDEDTGATDTGEEKGGGCGCATGGGATSGLAVGGAVLTAWFSRRRRATWS